MVRRARPSSTVRGRVVPPMEPGPTPKVLVLPGWTPMMVEPIPVSFEERSAHTPENIGKGAKMACELDSDIVKMQYSGDPESFQEIMSTLYRPVVILGGPGRNNERAVLQDIRHAMDAGAIGTTIGRNIWEHESPAKMVAALAAIVHEDATVDQAMRHLQPAFAMA